MQQRSKCSLLDIIRAPTTERCCDRDGRTPKADAWHPEIHFENHSNSIPPPYVVGYDFMESALMIEVLLDEDD